MIRATSPNQEGVEGIDSEEVWIRTETSAILVMSTSLLGTVLFFLIKEAYFYAGLLLLTSRCAIRGWIRAVCSSWDGLSPITPTTVRKLSLLSLPSRPRSACPRQPRWIPG